MNVNGKHYRTIWPSAKNKKIVQIIDQRHLPHRFVIEDLTCVDDFVAAIGEMHVRGAGLIGATAGFGMYVAALEAPRANFDASIQGSARRLLATRPTARNLAWAVNRQLAVMAEISSFQPNGQEATIERAYVTACQIADEDAEFCRNIGIHGQRIIRAISEKNRVRRLTSSRTAMQDGWPLWTTDRLQRLSMPPMGRA